MHLAQASAAIRVLLASKAAGDPQVVTYNAIPELRFPPAADDDSMITPWGVMEASLARMGFFPFQ